MLLEIFLLVLTSLVLVVCFKLQKHKNYWYERGVPNTGFKFFFGDDMFLFTRKESFHSYVWEEYKRFHGVPFYGKWGLFGKPSLVLRNDFDLIKSIWIKDFDHFAIANAAVAVSKSIWPSTREEKLMLNHVQNLHGDEWKNIRYAIMYKFMFLKE